MYARLLSDSILATARQWPVIAILGPRQSGKTTLARQLFPDLPYCSFEDPDLRRSALDDPRGLLALYPDGAVLDEVQHVPELLSYLQTVVDQVANEAGRRRPWVLTGSQNLLLGERVSQSLAGRVAVHRLLPLSREELGEDAPDDLDEQLLSGGYPAIWQRRVPPAEWLASYLQTYVERDVRSLRQIGDLADFQRFLRLVAGRVGQLVNRASLANDLGVAPNTVKDWLSVLEATFVIHRLPPYFRNFGKRLVKAPKLYFVDTGLAAHLLGIRSREQLQTHPARGALMENHVLSEALKAAWHRGRPPELYFWRDQTGNEVDLLLAESSAVVHAVEIKSGQTWSGHFRKGIERFRQAADELQGENIVVYGGTQALPQAGIRLLPWRQWPPSGLALPGL